MTLETISYFKEKAVNINADVDDFELQLSKILTMRDLCIHSNESALGQLRLRQDEIAKEINDDISGMHDDLIQLVNDFTCALSEKAEKDLSFNSSLLSDVDLQLRRLNETLVVISSFSDIFRRFNSMTSKVLSVEVDDTCNSMMYYGTETLEDEKATVTPAQANLCVQTSSHKLSEGQSSHLQRESSNESNGKRNTLSMFSIVEEALIDTYSEGKKRPYSDIDVVTVKDMERKGR